MNIEKIFISQTNTKLRPGIKIVPKYITIHETNNTNKGADGFAHARSLLKQNNDQKKSWHYTVDDSGIIYNSIPDNEVSNQIDDMYSQCNLSSIGIKICVNHGGIFRRAKYNTIQLIIHLMGKYIINLGNIYPCQKWSKEMCPQNILKKGWYHFIGELKYELDLKRNTSTLKK